MDNSDVDSDRKSVEARCIEFLQDRYRGSGGEGEWDGRFSSRSGSATGDLFGSLDALYALAMIGHLEAVTTTESRRRWGGTILSMQGADGWFRAGDRQRHDRVHATAYALGGLALLDRVTDGAGLGRLRSIQLDSDMEQRFLLPWRRLPLSTRTHFWRGSHKVAGVAAIVGQLHSAGKQDALGMSMDPAEWLDGWARAATSSMSSDSGLWFLAPPALAVPFSVLYRARHRPEYGHIGGAAHVYWILEKLGISWSRGAEVARWILDKTGSRAICEGEPYCLDFDRNFLLTRSRSEYRGTSVEQEATALLARTRSAILRFYAEREPGHWNPNSHKLPGAFAAVAEVDRWMGHADPSVGGWNDAFETVWWL